MLTLMDASQFFRSCTLPDSYAHILFTMPTLMYFHNSHANVLLPILTLLMYHSQFLRPCTITNAYAKVRSPILTLMYASEFLRSCTLPNSYAHVRSPIRTLIYYSQCPRPCTIHYSHANVLFPILTLCMLLSFFARVCYMLLSFFDYSGFQFFRPAVYTALNNM